MKEGFIIGAMLGMVAGAILYKHNCCDAKKYIDKGENAVKKEIKAMKNN